MSDTKKCPFCAEQIAVEANKCRWCGEWLSEKPEESRASTQSDSNNVAARTSASSSSTSHAKSFTQMIAGVAFVAMLCIGLFYYLKNDSPSNRPQLPKGAVSEIDWEGQVFKRGDRVRILGLAGSFKPKETGAAMEIAAGAGATGTMLWAEKRADRGFTHPYELIHVKWDEQDWHPASYQRRDETVHVGSFEALIHVEYLEHL